MYPGLGCLRRYSFAESFTAYLTTRDYPGWGFLLMVGALAHSRTILSSASVNQVLIPSLSFVGSGEPTGNCKELMVVCQTNMSTAYTKRKRYIRVFDGYTQFTRGFRIGE